jgi:hypothetical protein
VPSGLLEQNIAVLWQRTFQSQIIQLLYHHPELTCLVLDLVIEGSQLFRVHSAASNRLKEERKKSLVVNHDDGFDRKL